MAKKTNKERADSREQKIEKAAIKFMKTRTIIYPDNPLWDDTIAAFKAGASWERQRPKDDHN